MTMIPARPAQRNHERVNPMDRDPEQAAALQAIARALALGRAAAMRREAARRWPHLDGAGVSGILGWIGDHGVADAAPVATPDHPGPGGIAGQPGWPARLARATRGRLAARQSCWCSGWPHSPSCPALGGGDGSGPLYKAHPAT